MKYPVYPKYKDSGVEWLGEVPEGWDILPLKRLVSMKSGEQITSEDIEEAGEYPVYGGNGLRGYATDYTHDGFYPLVGRQGALCGNINYARGKFWASEHAVVVMPIKQVPAIWLGELLRIMNLGQYSVAAAQPGLAVDIIARLLVPSPSFEEQQAIAAFLDSETARIDALITEQEKLVSLLQEKRQAVISHAVTKGLNPDAPMKDSGVEWLGEVPEGWEVFNFRRIIARIEQGWSPNASSEPCQNGDWGVLKISAVKFGRFVQNENKALLDDVLPAEAYKVFSGDLLLTRANTPDLVGDCCVVSNDLQYKLMMSDLIYRVHLNSGIDAHFISYLLRSNFCRSQIKADARGSSMTMAKISQGHIKNWFVLIPSLSEQQSIVEYLDAETAKIDALITEADKAIELLKERRSAIISAAVTGKIDVRNILLQEAV